MSVHGRFVKLHFSGNTGFVPFQIQGSCATELAFQLRPIALFRPHLFLNDTLGKSSSSISCWLPAIILSRVDDERTVLEVSR